MVWDMCGMLRFQFALSPGYVHGGVKHDCARKARWGPPQPWMQSSTGSGEPGRLQSRGVTIHEHI